MVIQENLLIQYGAEILYYHASDFIFTEEKKAMNYYQILRGRVKLNNYNEDGTEFIHNILGEGQCIGEWLLFNEHAYPMNAIAMKETSVFSLPREQFWKLVLAHPEISKILLTCLSEKMYFKFVMSHNNTNKNPICKIWFFINYLRSYQFTSHPLTYEVHLTRQQIANYTGLTVETVIRSIKQLERDGKLKIKNGKIFI